MPTKIDFFDCSNDADMSNAERIISSKEVLKKEVVNFPHLMLVYTE